MARVTAQTGRYRPAPLPDHLRAHVADLAHRWRLSLGAALESVLQEHYDRAARVRGQVLGCPCEHCAHCPLVEAPPSDAPGTRKGSYR